MVESLLDGGLVEALVDSLILALIEGGLVEALDIMVVANFGRGAVVLGAVSTRGKVVFSGEFGLLTRVVVVVVVVVDRAYIGGMITFDIFRLGAGGSGRKVEVGFFVSI